MLNTQKPIQELSIEDTLTMTINIYMSNFIIFFAPVAIAVLISGVLSKVVTDYFANVSLMVTTPADLLGFFLTLLAVVFIMAIFSWIVSTIASGICVKSAADLIEGGKANLGVSFDVTVSRIISLLGATLIVGILIFIGIIALIVPGIILAIMFCLVIPTIMIENVGVMDSMSRSRKLVNNRWLKTFAIFLIIALGMLFITFVAGLIAVPFGIIGWLINIAITALLEPVAYIAITVHYYSMWAREQARKVPLPPPPPF